MPVKVHVVYCGGWGYGSKYRRLSDELVEEYGNDIEVTGESTAGITGYLEVTVNGELVHSKKNGDGYVDNDQKLSKIKAAIDAALK